MARHSGTRFGGYARPVRPWLAAMPILAMLLLSSSVRADEFRLASTLLKELKFTSNNGTAPFDQSITGVGLGAVGQALLLIWTDQTTEGTENTTKSSIGWGAATSATQRWAVSGANQDNVNTTNNSRGSSTTRCIFQVNEAGSGSDYEADFKSWDGVDGNFTLTWQVNPGAGRIFYAIVIGGADITNAKAMTLTLNANTGNQSYTGVGFQPDVGIYACTNQTATGATTNRTLAFGVAVSTTKRWSNSINADDGVTMTTQMDWNKYQSNTRCLVCLTNAASTLDIEFDHVSFDSDGVTFNQVNAPTVNTILFCLFLKGGQYDAGNFTTCTGASCTNVVSTALQPKGVLFGHIESATLDTVIASETLMIGWGSSTDGTQEAVVAVASSDATLPTQVQQTSQSNQVIDQTFAGAGHYDMTALGASSFTIQLGSGSAGAFNAQFLAIGDSPVSLTTIDWTNPADFMVPDNRFRMESLRASWDEDRWTQFVIPNQGAIEITPSYDPALDVPRLEGWRFDKIEDTYDAADIPRLDAGAAEIAPTYDPDQKPLPLPFGQVGLEFEEFSQFPIIPVVPAPDVGYDHPYDLYPALASPMFHSVDEDGLQGTNFIILPPLADVEPDQRPSPLQFGQVGLEFEEFSQFPIIPPTPVPDIGWEEVESGIGRVIGILPDIDYDQREGGVPILPPFVIELAGTDTPRGIVPTVTLAAMFELDPFTGVPIIPPPPPSAFGRTVRLALGFQPTILR